MAECIKEDVIQRLIEGQVKAFKEWIETEKMRGCTDSDCAVRRQLIGGDFDFENHTREY